MSSHHRSPSAPASREQYKKRPRRHQKSHRKALLSSQVRLLALLVVVVSLVSAAAASEAHVHRRARGSASLPVPSEEPPPPPQLWRGPALLVDSRPPPLMPRLHDAATRPRGLRVSRRALQSDPKATDANFQIPQPFDSALSNNFTSSCASFFKKMLGSDTIKNCRPFSLMLQVRASGKHGASYPLTSDQTSSGLFDASKSFVRITRTLEATCAVNTTQCTGAINGLARELTTDGACRVDYNNDNPQVVQAYNGLIAYAPLYRASCLKDSSSNFCYANAVTNTTSAGTDTYPYYMPLGVALPGGSRPTCNTCLQDTMAIFSSFAANTTQPISQTYGGGASLMSIACGKTFVNVTVAPLKGAASSTTVAFAPTLTLITIIFFLLCA